MTAVQSPPESALPQLLEANARYAATFDLQALDAPPRKRLAVVACMDARFDPARALGLEEGDAHVIRNAGGILSRDALRSLVISHWQLGTREALVVGHTDCGMVSFTNEQLRARVGEAAEAVDFLPFSDVRARVAESVAEAVSSPLLPDGFMVHGFVYDVRTGLLEPV